MGLLRRTDPAFVAYLSAHWLYIRRAWAIHAQKGLVHFGNTTNNRLENANGRLKRHTHHKDRLVHAIQKVSRHCEWLIREYEMQATYRCDRKEMIAGECFVKAILVRMTTYAAHLVMRHVGETLPSFPFMLVGNAKVRCFYISHVNLVSSHRWNDIVCP